MTHFWALDFGFEVYLIIRKRGTQGQFGELLLRDPFLSTYQVILSTYKLSYNPNGNTYNPVSDLYVNASPAVQLISFRLYPVKGNVLK